MLYIGVFDLDPIDGDAAMQYHGDKAEYIIQRQIGYFSLIVNKPDGSSEVYGCGSLSNAIASIEALENGEEI